MSVNQNNAANPADRVYCSGTMPRWITSVKTLRQLRREAWFKETGLLMDIARLERRIGDVATEREQALALLKALVIGWDSAQSGEFLDALTRARAALGFTLAPREGRDG